MSDRPATRPAPPAAGPGDPPRAALRLDHVSLVAGDLAVTAAFYDAVLGAAGAPRVVGWTDVEDADEVGEEAVGYGVGGSWVLWVVAGPRPTRGAHVAVRVDGPAAVDAAAAAGGGRPRHRALDRPGYYGVMLEDPDGNVVEVFTAD